MAKEISTVGAKVVFSNGYFKSPLTVDEFSDEGTPFDSPDVDFSNNQKNLNGEMISSRTPSVYPFSITVIPGSIADQRLTEFFKKSGLQKGQLTDQSLTGAQLYCDIEVVIPGIVQVGASAGTSGASTGDRTYGFTNARPKSGPVGPSTSAEGRQSARTFSFEAEGIY